MPRPPRLCFAVVLGVFACGPSQRRPGQVEQPAAASVQPALDAERMLEVVGTLSHDDMGGRFSLADDDLRQAADYLAQAHGAAGLQPVGDAYLVEFPLQAGSEPGDEFFFWVERDGENLAVTDGDFATVMAADEPVVGDVILVTPADLDRARDELAGKIVLGWLPEDPPKQALSRIQKAAADAKAAGLLVVGGDPVAHGTAPPRGELATIWVQRAAAKRYFGLDGAEPKTGLLDAIRVSLAPKPRALVEPVPNVLAMLPGTENPDEIVILGAHYDHIGTKEHGVFCRPSPDQDDDDQICNGADDNASGSAMVLEIARALAEAGYRPKRTIVFAHFAGEELGLHGSKALAEQPPEVPPFSNGRVVAMINLDMVGRLGDDGLAIGGIGSSPAWMEILDSIDDRGLPILYERAISGRSDHASFYEKDIPVLFFFTGVHADYHRAGDELDKINREGMAAIGELVLDVVQRVADGHPIPFAAPRSPKEGLVSRLPGTDPETIEKRTPKKTR